MYFLRKLWEILKMGDNRLPNAIYLEHWIGEEVNIHCSEKGNTNTVSQQLMNLSYITRV